MFSSIMLWSGIIIGGSAVYMALGGSSEHNTNEEVNKCAVNRANNNEELTYDYFNNLTLEEQERYFNDNLDLKYYKEDSTCGFTNDKYYNSIHAKEISRRTGKTFNNINKTH